MQIRRPLASEQSAIQTLVQTVVDETYGGQSAPAPLPVDTEDWTRGWVAVDGERIVGIVLTADDWIEDLWLAREARGRGVGGRLLEHAEREIRERGYTVGTLRVVATNTRALAFYERNGWQRTRHYPHERVPIEMVELSKSL